jgi:glycosyltransferase involved in cell wall biosynthesis
LQEEVYEKHYKNLPPHSVIENAIPEGAPKLHDKHEPFRLLFLGRFVGFKNLPTLVRAVAAVREPPLRRNVTLTFVGDGPMKVCLEALVRSLKLQGWVRFLPPTHNEEKKRYFADYDLLVLPSLTELSPNVALEARAHGLPVLLSSETGLSDRLREGMVVRPLRTEEQIVQAVLEAMTNYANIAQNAANSSQSRSWGDVTEEFLKLTRAALE